MLRVVDRFGGSIDGALRQLGYPPLTPRELRGLTMRVADVASAEALYHRWESAQRAGKAVEMTTDEARWFEELLNLGYACPGCGQLPGSHHLDGCPCDPDPTGGAS